MELRSDLSKKYIAEALICLMKKKDYASITNKDITNKAGFSHITIYRNFKSKEDILKYYLDDIFQQWKLDWNEENNIAYNIFTFFQKNRDTIDLLYKANLQHLLIDNILSCCNYSKEDINVVAYAKVTVAYFIFGWCDEWYKRGMFETPEEMARLFENQKNNN